MTLPIDLIMMPLGKFLTAVDISYVPQSAGGKITDGTDMLFLNMEVSF